CRTARKKARNHAACDRRFCLFPSLRRAIQEGSPGASARDKSLLEQPVQRRHHRRVGHRARKYSLHPSHGALAVRPDHLHHFALEVAEHSTKRIVGGSPAKTPEPFEHGRPNSTPVSPLIPCPLSLVGSHVAAIPSVRPHCRAGWRHTNAQPPRTSYAADAGRTEIVDARRFLDP